MDRDEQPRIGGPPTGSAALTKVVYDGRQLVIHADGTTTVLDEAPALQSVAPRILPGPSLVEPDPIGRDDLVERVYELLRVHTSVQLWGPPGIGRRTVAHAAVRQFGAGAPSTTVYAHGQGLGELVQNIFESLFYTVAYRPAVDELRDLVSETQAWIVVEDCELDAYDVGQLVEIFPQCVFVLVSPEETLRHGVAMAVPPLSEDDAFHLAQTWIGPLGLDMSIGIVREACRQAAGVPARLAMYAAFLQSVATRPNTPIPPPIPPFAQATVLLAALTPAAREVLTALVALDTEGDGASLTALAGLPRAADIGTELLASGLVTKVGIRYRPTVDAIAVLTRQPEPWDPALAADRMRVLMGPAADPVASPRLLLGVVRAAVAIRADGPAALLVRESAPWLLAACQVEVWAEMIGYAALATGRSPRHIDAGFFVHEDRIRAAIASDLASNAPTLLGTRPASPPTAPITTKGSKKAAARSATPKATKKAVKSPGRPAPDGPPERPLAAAPPVSRRRRSRIAVITLVLILLASGAAVAATRLTSSHRTTAGTGTAPPPGTAIQPGSTPSLVPSPRTSVIVITPSGSLRPSGPLITITVVAPPVTGGRTPTVPPTTPATQPPTSATPPPPSPTPPPVSDPATVVTDYFGAINRQDYLTAWNLGGDNLGGTYQQFVDGFSGTVSDVITIVSVVGNVAQITLDATQTGGTVLHWAGPYTVINGEIVAAKLRRTGATA